MKVLMAGEESQTVTIAFRRLGHEAYSCDILPCSGGHPAWHIQDDVLGWLCGFNNMPNAFSGGGYHYDWDMMLAFPPCTHLAVSGARWFKDKKSEQKQAIEFFMALVNAPIHRIAIENPIGVMSTVYRKPDQIVQPWMFGHPTTKATCLWLKNLPKLKHTNVVMPLFNDCHKMPPSPTRGKDRSRTLQGFANAMATQWGNL
uniref:Putative methyltransferase n=1 Tax=viral metagenome TaxID=1070528 RepID=A0A6M3LG96_9ZZZZ